MSGKKCTKHSFCTKSLIVIMQLQYAHQIMPVRISIHRLICFYVSIILLYNLFCWVHNRNFSIHAQKQYSIKDVNKMCRFHYGPLCLDHIEIYMQNKIVLTFMCASAAPGPGHAWGVLKKSELHFYCLKSYTYMYRQRNTDTRVLITF